jgi:uncharacterized protein (DUF2141 family)
MNKQEWNKHITPQKCTCANMQLALNWWYERPIQNLQDMNDSWAIDKNGLGIPKEPYAFSNDIRPKLRAPSFDDCKFIYSKKENSITVKMGK